jgi:hypothetical protein
MLGTLLSVLALTLLATAATAQVRPPTSQRTCSANRRLVMRDGAECTVDQFPEPAWVPSSNNPQCFIGYRFKDGSADF